MDVYLPETAILAVKRGAEFLDERLGTSWVQRIELGALQLSSCKRCVLGQLYAEQPDLDANDGFNTGYERGIKELGLNDDTMIFDDPVSTTHLGFEVDDDYEYADLTRAWTELIQEREES